MNKKAIIFHGTNARPDVAWYPWLAKQLEARGYKVERPYYPSLNQEPIKTFLPKVLSNHVFDENTTLIGHSGGAALLLAILENLNTTIHQAFLVAGYSTPPNKNQEPVLQSHYNWEKIKASVKSIYFLNSVEDPYGCDDKQGRSMFDKLGGTQIILNEGHFGSPEQEYLKFDLLNKLID